MTEESLTGKLVTLEKYALDERGNAYPRGVYLYEALPSYITRNYPISLCTNAEGKFVESKDDFKEAKNSIPERVIRVKQRPIDENKKTPLPPKKVIDATPEDVKGVVERKSTSPKEFTTELEEAKKTKSTTASKRKTTTRRKASTPSTKSEEK